MTGRDLILYILQNKLEDEPVYKDGKFIGFVTAKEAAVKLNVDLPTVYVLMKRGHIEGVEVKESVLIPDNQPLKLGR